VLGRILRFTLWVLASAAGVVVAVVGAWLVDDAIVHDGQVLRNVEIAGRPIGGLDGDDLSSVLADLGDTVAATDFTLATSDRRLVATNATVGLSLDRTPVAAAAMAAGRSGGVLDDLESWLRSFREPRVVAPVYALDRSGFEKWLGGQSDRIRALPIEPTFTGRNGPLEVTAGVSGAEIDVATATDAAVAAAAAGEVPVEVAVPWAELPPRVGADGAAAGVEAAEALAAHPLTVRVGNRVVRIGRETVRRWIDSAEDGDRLIPVLDPTRVATSLEVLLADITTDGRPPRFTIVDGEVEVDAGLSPMRCCGGGAAEVVAVALEAGTRGAIALPLVPVADPEEIAASLGIEMIVGEFTTNHQCCEARVLNIHRIADLVRGVVIAPGARFSLNEHVGERTVEKGFVTAGSIQLGRFKDAVGGGVSQFATTLFNAAFFAGLDFEAYQSHSIVISRYPYGREATISYPQPDLVVVNQTPYGMLIWTEYTDTSITVQLWSTPWFEVRETGQSVFGVGACTRVETYRQRIDPEGRVLEDVVFATYRPGEGLDCAGRPTPEP